MTNGSNMPENKPVPKPATGSAIPEGAPPSSIQQPTPTTDVQGRTPKQFVEWTPGDPNGPNQ